MKVKIRKAKIKPFKGVTSVYFPSGEYNDGLLDFIENMGYFTYEDPSNNEAIIISDKVLTYGGLKKIAKSLDIDLDWWNKETDFNEMLDEELDEI